MLIVAYFFIFFVFVCFAQLDQKYQNYSTVRIFDGINYKSTALEK